jgi:hypothetical protein
MPTKKKMKMLASAPKRVKIDVTAGDIKRGVWLNEESCPIALAVKRTMGDSPKVVPSWAGGISVSFGDGSRGRYHIPQKADKFIRAFDRYDQARHRVKPFSFVAVFNKYIDAPPGEIA